MVTHNNTLPASAPYHRPAVATSLLGHQIEMDNCKTAHLNPTTHMQALDGLTNIHSIGLLWLAVGR